MEASKETRKKAKIEIYGEKFDSCLPFVEVPDGFGSKNRSPTEDELKRAVTFARKLKRLRRIAEAANEALETHLKSCPHGVSVDQPGYPYDLRSCFACGRDEGMI